MRGAAYGLLGEDDTSVISTHAPHARRGVDFSHRCGGADNFYSRASCEARLKHCHLIGVYLCISTHAPHARRGSSAHLLHGFAEKFLLTRLMRGAAEREYVPAAWWFKFLLTRLMRGAANRSG